MVCIFLCRFELVLASLLKQSFSVKLIIKKLSGCSMLPGNNSDNSLQNNLEI